MKFNRTNILVIFLILLFLFLRFYKLNQSFLFFGDTGRDYLVLFDALENKKPPLLGPQTSTLPFNQSAIYFYLLFPIFFLTNQFLFSSQITLSIFYISLFLFGIKYLKKYPKLQKSLFIVFFLVSIHPQQIIQSRYVWNPSFVTPCLVAAFYLFQVLQKEFNKKLIFFFTFSLALATAFSYSTVPILIAFMILSVFIFKKKSLQIYAFTFLNLILVNLPTIFFELRHNFLLTNMMLNQEKLAQTGKDLVSKLTSLNRYLISINSDFLKIIILIVLLLSIFFSFKNKKQENQYLFQSIILLLLVSLIILISPITIHAHYIFGILIPIFLIFSFIDLKFSLFICITLSFSYLNKTNISSYFSKSYRSTEESLRFAQQICQQEKEPLFVSVQSGNHNYHDGVAFKYLLKRSGCNVIELDTQINNGNHMIVIVDNSTYEHGKTSYNELTQFGNSKQIKEYIFSKNLKAYILEKIK